MKRKAKFRGVIRGLYDEKPETGLAVLVVEVEPGEWVEETNRVLRLDSGWSDSQGYFVTDVVLCIGDHDEYIKLIHEKEGRRVVVVVDENGAPSYEF